MPGAGNSKAYNRYAYVEYNPINFNDPNGYSPECVMSGASGCLWWTGLTGVNAAAGMESYANDVDANFSMYNVSLQGNWTTSSTSAVINAIQKVGDNFAESKPGYNSAASAFSGLYQGIVFTWDVNCFNCRSAEAIQACGNDFASPGCGAGGAYTYSRHNITFASLSGGRTNDLSRMTKNVVHELGHSFNQIVGNPAATMPSEFPRYRDRILQPNPFDKNRYDWQQNLAKTGGETYADMFIAWTYGVWNNDASNSTIVDQAKVWFESTAR